MKAVTILSGGMDSATLAYHLAAQGFEQTFLSFNYGQRHVRELACAAAIAGRLGCKHLVVNLPDLGKVLNSALTTQAVDVPEGHYAEDNMKLTVVPNRNAIMLSMAWGVACTENAMLLAYGAHAGDHAIYPDCRAPFYEALQHAFKVGTEGLYQSGLSLVAPFISLNKGDIVALGHKLGVPYEHTWTCYKGGEKACGKCGSCCERLEAFSQNGLEDPVPYEDREYWKQAAAAFQQQGKAVQEQ